MVRNKYNFKQSELYTIARLILATISEPLVLALFTAFKGKYTALWVTDRLLDVDKAEDEPDEEARNAVHEIARAQLLDLVQDSLNTFNALERYIIEVFPLNEQKASIEAAGGTKYAEAADFDFDACQQMLNSALNFVTDNEITLLNGGLNMPAGFKADLSDLLTTFQTKHTNFLTSETFSEVQTGEKIKGNNAVYEEIITSINADAQVIFHKPEQEAVRKQFVLEHQLYLVRGAGVAGIRLHVTNSVTGQDIEAAVFTIPAQNISIETNATGRALQLQLAAANYLVKVNKPGFIEFTTTVTVEIGTVKRLNVSLVPL